MKMFPKVHQFKDKVHKKFPPELHEKAYELIIPKYQRSLDANMKSNTNTMKEFQVSNYQKENADDIQNTRRTSSTQISGIMNQHAMSFAYDNNAST